ncbi:zinc finger protein 638-like [Acanthopagrus latus]|uniref:zinc finger protein 638-like n=1 Tax=Acanthopagrus latus TaxID=8177 RepID=UPI00187BD1D6|nr:zinc finger protein 638-like [Acanthopagrus latus]
MSRHPHNPFDSRNQSSTQGQYGLSTTQAERDPGMAPSYLGPGSSFSSSGASSAIPDNAGGIFSMPMSQSMNYGSECSRALMEENIEKSIAMHISKAREESRFGKPMHHPIDKGTHSTGLQRNQFHSSDTRMASHPISSASASLGHRQSDVGSGNSSWDWLSSYKKPTADDTKFYSSSDHDMQSIPGLGDYDCRESEKFAAPTEPSQPKYTSESAANILQRFGLEKEDLEHLIAYPDDQMTPENLPFILHQIRLQKAKRATTACQSKPYPDPQPTGCVGQMDSHSLSDSWGSGMRQEEVSSAVLQPSKVIDYGHTGKYTGGVGGETGMTRCSKANSGRGGGMLLMDTCDTRKNSRGPLQKHTAEVKSSSLGSSNHQATSVTSLSSSKSWAPPSHDQTKRLQTSQTLLSLFSVPKNDTDIRVVTTGASKRGPLKEPASDRQSTSKTQPHASLLRGVHPGRSGLVLVGSNNNSGAKDQSKIRSQGSTVAEQMKKQQSQKQPAEQQSKQQKEKEQMMWPPVFSVAKSVPSAAVIPNIIDASKSMQQPMSSNHTTLPTSHWQPPANVPVFKGLPTLAMMQDYAAASPRIFPHTCSLCNKECTQMKDWISHQNTSHHLESCTLLRKQYPDWDGEIALVPRALGKDAKPSTSSSIRYHHASERRREKRSSRSRSPHSTRYTRRSRSRSCSPRYDRPTTLPYRSRSRSSERRSSPRRRDERRSSPRRSHERQLSPRRFDGRLSPPRRMDSRRSPPRRNREGRSSTGGRLVQKLLETSSASQSLPMQSDLEAVVKTLAPALLAELAKMKSSSSSSSSSAKKMSTTKPSEGRPSLQSSEASSATTTKTGKSSPPTMVRLEGINSTLSHNDVVTAVEHFGKTKSIVLFRTKLQAIVCFEKEEDAKKLKSIKGFDVKGLTISVVREEETVSNVQMTPPQKKPTMSITATSTSRTVLLPSPNVPSFSCSPEPSPSGAQTPTTRVETVEPMEVGRCVDGTEERPQTTGAVPENSADKPYTIQPATSETLSTEMNQDDPVTAVNTQMDTAAAANLTIGEKIEQHLFLHMIPSFDRKYFFSPNFFRLDKKQLLLSGLPAYYDGCYTEDEVARLLRPYGLRYKSTNTSNIFVIPQTGMAFVRMHSAGAVRNVLNAFKTKPLVFKSCTLGCRVLCNMDMTPPGFYKRLMEILNSPVVDDGLRTFFINNVSPRYTRELRKAMGNTFSLRNYLPLLNKVFIEFETVLHADRFQVWYDIYHTLQSDTGHKLEKLRMPKDVAVSEQQLATDSLTTGEMLEKHLDLNKIVRLKSQNYLSPKYSQHGLKQMMVTRLPKYYDGCYTEEDVVKLLTPFGFEYTDDSIYVLPQMCMALFRMPTVENLRSIMLHCKTDGISLKGSKLFFDVVAGGIAMTPLGFYKTVMKLVRFAVQDNGARTILISNISPSEVRYLKETLKPFVRVRNYLPLINKLFVEFEEAADANRFGGWYDLQKPPPGYKIHVLHKPGKCRSNVSRPVTAVKTQWYAESTKVSSTVAEVIKPQPATSTPASTAVPLLTTEEMVENHMDQDRRVCFNRQNFTRPKLDFTDDSVSSSLPIACLFDEGNSSMNDSVNEDKLNDDVKDSSPEPLGSSSSSKERLERQSSGVLPASEQISPSVSEPPSFSSPLPTETSSSPGQKMLQSGTSDAVEASIETHLEPLGEEAKATEGAVAKSDHQVSGEGSAAKTVESETKVETSAEMHPSSQGHGEESSQTQSLEVNDDVSTPKDQSKSREEVNEDDVDKHAEEDDVENYLILDSLDDQTDKQMDDGDRGCSSETHPAVPEEDQTLHEQSYQVMDSVDDEGRACPEDDKEMEMDDSFQQLSGEDAGPVVGKSHEEDAVADFKDMENPAVEEPFQDTEQETFEILDSVDDQTAAEDDNQKLETGIDQISKEDTGPTEQEDTFQVIDSLENQPETDNKEKRTRKGETTVRKDGATRRSGRTNTASKTEEKEKSPKKQDKAVKKYETRTKMDTTAGISEEMLYEVVDSVEDDPVQEAIISEKPGRRRSARGKKTEVSERPDSAEEENTNGKPTVTTRSLRGRERASKKDASNEKTKKEDTATRRNTPARESQEQRENTPKKEEKCSPKGSTPTKKSDIVVSENDPTCDIVIPAKVIKPATRQKGRRGRPKKEVQKEKDNQSLKMGDGDTSEKMAEEEAATYQILDSVEDETVDDQFPGQSESARKQKITKYDDEQTKNSVTVAGSPRNEEEEEEEEEPLYQIVDWLEDDDEEEPTATEVSDKEGRENGNNEAKEGESTEKGEMATHGTKALEGPEKDLEEVYIDPSATEEFDPRKEDSTAQKDIKYNKSPTKSQCDTETPEGKNIQKPPEKRDTTSTLDEVSEEELPDDTAEEEELRKRQAATKDKQGRGTREREERGQRNWVCYSRGGVGSGGRTRRSKERWRENEEKVEFDTKELVTLDEVEADKAGEEGALESQDRDGELSEGELQTFVTLDEFVEEEEEEEDLKAEETLPETSPLLQEDESVDSLNPETLVTLDEAGGDEEEKPDEDQVEKTLRSAKREHDDEDDTEESMNFVTVDEVGEVEEEEEEKEVVTTRTRSQAKKRTRQTPVRKSTRGKKEERVEEKEAVDALPSLSSSSSCHKDPSMSSSDAPLEVQKREEQVGAARQADIDAASAGQEMQLEHPENQTVEESVEKGEEEKERWSRTDIKAVQKRKRELVGPEAKRSRSRSPCVASDFKLLTFKPNNPLGQEFVVPKLGYFCNLCSVFYLTESTAKNTHCSSQRHFDNLKKHYQKLEQEPS